MSQKLTEFDLAELTKKTLSYIEQNMTGVLLSEMGKFIGVDTKHTVAFIMFLYNQYKVEEFRTVFYTASDKQYVSEMAVKDTVWPQPSEQYVADFKAIFTVLPSAQDVVDVWRWIGNQYKEGNNGRE